MFGGILMGRKPIDLDMEAALDLLERGERVPAIASELGISASTLRNRIAQLQKRQGLLLQYRAIQSLQLTELQARVLEAITPDKINDAPLRDLVMSYKILKNSELTIEGKPNEIKGLVAHLIHMEKQEAALKNGVEGEVIEFSENEDEKYCSLGDLDDQEF